MGLAVGTEQHRQAGSRTLVYRWNGCPGGALCCWRRKKGDPEEPADHALGRSRGGFGTKIHLLCDGGGVPLHFEITAGQRHESTEFEAVMEAVEIPQPVGRPRKRPRKLAGDKAYRVPRILDWLRSHGIQPVIPKKSNEKLRSGRPEQFDQLAYRGRNVVERCVGWLKECRRILSRFEKTALNFIGMIQLAMIERYLRILC